MTKDEQIKEMAKIINTEIIHGEDNCGMPTNNTVYDISEALYNAGYRKVSKNYAGTDEVLRSIGYRPTEEVRKETAKEILKEFYKIKWGQSELDNVCIRLAEKYGVEVEE